MEHSIIKLVICSTLMTLGFLVMLLCPMWLMVLGAALIALADFFSSRHSTRRRHPIIYLVVAAVAVTTSIRYLRRGDGFTLETRPSWLWVVFAVIWLAAILSEFRSWRRSRTLT
jgi:hypothetical protein